MHDNAPPTRANMTKDFLANEGIQVLPWPAVSPDLNPIENVWAQLRTGLTRYPTSHSSEDLFALLCTLWDEVDASPAISSMRRRIESTIAVDGGHTKY